jgi:hypothetical protein
LALLDFYLFGKLKKPLAEQEFKSPEELLLAIRGINDSIGRADLESVSAACERRLSQGIQMKGQYIT